LFQHYCGLGRQSHNWSSPGKMRMRCDMTRHQSDRHCNVRALIHQVKCACSVQRIGTNTNNLTTLKRAQPYVVRLSAFFENQVLVLSYQRFKCNNITSNLMATNTRSPRQVVWSSACKIISHTQSLHALLPEIPP